jgi:hypothetical protein
MSKPRPRPAAATTKAWSVLRTGDGLYRFHSLAIMGMPIAVGHYIYTDIDRDSAGQAWQSWLDRLFA